MISNLVVRKLGDLVNNQSSSVNLRCIGLSRRGSDIKKKIIANGLSICNERYMRRKKSVLVNFNFNKEFVSRNNSLPELLSVVIEASGRSKDESC